MTVARELAEFLVRTSPSDIPQQALEHAAMLIASTLASAALGSGLESSGIIRDLSRERGGRPDASLWFSPGPKLPMAEAAQVNAVASDAAASDDSDLRNIVHAGTTLTATALAVAEGTGVGGEEVLAAIVLGYEAAGRIGEAVTPGFRTRGFHGCLVAIFSGAVAAGRLLRLDAGQIAQAIALSATSIGGLAAAANTSVAPNTTRDWQRCSGSTPHARHSAAIRPKRVSSRLSTGFSRSMAASKAPAPGRA
jgi:2-methylcitrate dehydratase PrpD